MPTTAYHTLEPSVLGVTALDSEFDPEAYTWNQCFSKQTCLAFGRVADQDPVGSVYFQLIKKIVKYIFYIYHLLMRVAHYRDVCSSLGMCVAH